MDYTDHSDRIPTKKVLVVGFGNAFRNDDCVGLLVAKAIAKRQIRGVRCVNDSREPLGQVQLWSEFEILYLIDAMSSGSVAGTIHRFDPRLVPLPVEFFSHSTHDFGVAECIELAKALGTLPDQCHVFGIEGIDFGWGRVLTPAVLATAERVGEIIISEIGQMPMIEPAMQTSIYPT